MTFGEVIRKRRLDHPAGLKLKDVARVCGVSVNYISLVERNKRKPSYTVVKRIFAALELEPDKFVRFLELNESTVRERD